MMKYVLGIPFLVAARASLAMICLLLVSGCASGGASPSSMGPGPTGQTSIKNLTGETPDTLRVGELILIEFSGVEVPPARHEERIKTDGHITLPSIGPIEAAGKTRGELEEA